MIDGDEDAAQPSEAGDAAVTHTPAATQPNGQAATTEQIAFAAATVAVATATTLSSAPPAAQIARPTRPRWRNPEFDEEREEMRKELEAMLAEARDPFANGAADAERLKRSRREIVQARELAGLTLRQEHEEDGGD